VPALGEGARALWGKALPRGSAQRKQGCTWHPLACHMLDSAEAAGWLWDHFLSPGTKASIDAAAIPGVGDGRALLRWLAALHDLGKATPSFQVRSDVRADAVRAAGLPAEQHAADGAPSHAHLSGLLVMGLLRSAGWERGAVSWVALTMAGHHGVFPAANWHERRPYEWQVGTGAPGRTDPWVEARDQLLAMARAHAGLADLAAATASAPELPLQLAISGAVILADWLASNEDVFEYAGELPQGYPAMAAARTAKIADVIGMHDRWMPDDGVPGWGAGRLYASRFGREPRPVQQAAYAVAAGGGRGLLLIEAPMGEGKTEAALAAAEVLAVRAGADGLFIGLPTKATANQMYSRVGRWLCGQAGVQVVTLAHGSARRHGPYRELLVSGVGVDEQDGGIAASAWLAGPKKALLAPVAVGTIDHLLLAGVSSRHVALRHLGLSGKVVVVDEVHACDAYMSAILMRVLSWLGAAGIPVVLLSATLAAGQRQCLLAAYAGRRTADDDDAVYPRLSWVPAPDRIVRRLSRRDDARPVQVHVESPAAARSCRIAVRMLDENDAGVVPALADELTAGRGCALVVRNTVRRAQDTYRALRASNDEAEVTLAHARFTAADRRDREDKIIGLFGPDGRRARRHIVVGTQVLEQSLDCDFDVLITDLAPIDLLFQRAGRVHRHPRPARSRGRLQQPQMFVAGRVTQGASPPGIPRGSRVVYGDHLLWRTEAALLGYTALEIPGDVPRLVDQVYGGDRAGPAGWQPAMEQAAAEAEARRADMAAQAETIMLPTPAAASLASIHSRANVGDAVDEATPVVQAHVRIGPPTMEVMLLRRTGQAGVAATVSAGVPREIPLNREPDADTTDAALDQLIRLPVQVTAAAAAAASPQARWVRSPWLARVPVLLLPADGSPLRLGRYMCSYSPEMGLEVADGR
jgi:CRISPR-associated endonuclease/helicase Cas3